MASRSAEIGFTNSVPASSRSQVGSSKDDLVRVEATVLAVVPSYSVVKVQARDGFQYSLTRHTKGIVLSDLHEGQRVLCTVTRNLLRVVAAEVLA
jgi:hypothetical protein